jgi:phage shock protein PspC (stress-responsive transcriptional regulator)
MTEETSSAAPGAGPAAGATGTATDPGPTPAGGPPPPPPYARPPLSQLRRSRTDRHISGVSGGLGRFLGVDPLIVRILFVVLALFGGTGILLYALGWLLIPEEGQEESEGQRLFNGRSQSKTSTVIALIVVIVLTIAAVGALLDTGPGLGGLGALIVIAVIVVLLLNRDRGPDAFRPAPAATYGPVEGPQPPPATGAYGQTPGTAYAAAPAATQPLPTVPPPGSGPPEWTAVEMPPPPPTPPRERSVLGLLTVSVALIAVGLMVAWNTVSDDDFLAAAVVGTALAVVAAGLLVGAYHGRSRGLIVLGIFLSIATSATAAASDGIDGGIGERRWVPTTVAAAERPYRLGIGDADLDLTRLPAGSEVEVDVRLGVGDLTVLVPSDATVVVDGDVAAGQMQILGEHSRDGTDLQDRITSAGVGSSGTRITIDAKVGFGNLEVTR